MNKLKKNLLILTCCGLAATFAGAKARVWANPPADNAPESVPLQELMGKPVNFAQHQIVFTCRFASAGKLFRQNGSAFDIRTHANFAVWPANAQLWDKNVRRNLVPSLYLRRSNTELLNKLDRLKRYDLLIIGGIVNDGYANLPWIEVTSLQVVPEKEAPLTEGLLAELAKGEELLRDGKKADAARVLQSAVSVGVPDYINDHVAARLALCTDRPEPAKPAADDPMALVATGRKLAAKGDIAGAVDSFRQAGKGESPLLKSVWFYRELAQLYLLAAEDDATRKAQNLFEYANKLAGGNDAQSLYYLGKIAADGKDFTKAEELLNQCLKADPDNALARKLMTGVVASRLVDRAPAPVAKKVEVPADYLQTGEKLLRQGRFAEAEANLRAALLNPSEPDLKQVRTLLASALLAQNKSAEAMKILESLSAEGNNSEAGKTGAAPATPAARSGNREIPALSITDLNLSVREMDDITRELDSLQIGESSRKSMRNTQTPVEKAPAVAPAPEAAIVPAAESGKAVAAPVRKPQPAKPVARTTDPSLPDWAM